MNKSGSYLGVLCWAPHLFLSYAARYLYQALLSDSYRPCFVFGRSVFRISPENRVQVTLVIRGVAFI